MNFDSDFSKLFNGLSGENRELLWKASTRKTYKKNEYLVEPDDRAAFVFVVEKGITRKYIFNSGKEITTNFSFRDDFCFPLNNYMPNSGSDEYIQALTDTEVSVLNLDEFNKIKNNDIELLQFEVYINEMILLSLAARLREFQTLDAKERYLQLLKKEPNIVQNVPLTHIASYLGITLGSLSRIRGII